jgi:hypothetical protein
MMQMVYRLRPDKPGVRNPFTPDDYERLLVEQDYGPYFRSRFREIVYRVPALSYLRDMYRNFKITDEDMRGYHQDLGYNPTDSERFMEVDRLVRDRMRATESHGFNPTAIAKAFAAETMDAAEVTQRMEALGYEEQEAQALMLRAETDLAYTVTIRARSRAQTAAVAEVKKAQQAGVMTVEDATSALRDIGYPQRFAEGIAMATDASMRVGLVQKATSRVRSAYLRGDITVDQARGALTALGIVPLAVTDFTNAWQIEFTPKHKQRTASQIVNDLSLGEIDTPSAMSRLRNLGYTDVDSRLYIADAQRRLLMNEAKAQRSRDTATKRQVQELEKVEKQAKRQQEEARSRLRRLSPVGRLQSWVGKGIIDEAYFTSRMVGMGYGPGEIANYYAEACKKKGASCPTPPAVTPPAGGS